MRSVTCTLGGQSGGETVVPQDWERADAVTVRLGPSAFPDLRSSPAGPIAGFFRWLRPAGSSGIPAPSVWRTRSTSRITTKPISGHQRHLHGEGVGRVVLVRWTLTGTLRRELKTASQHVHPDGAPAPS